MDPLRTEVVFLVGELVSLRPLEREDAPALVRWLNDPDVREGLQGFRPLNLAAEYAFLESLSSTQEKQVVVGIVERSSGALVGACGLHDISWRDRRAQFGIFLGEKSRWGRGVGREASRLLIGYAFRTLGLHRVELHVYAFNTRALRTYQALGFVHEGTLREHHFHDGRFVDTQTMAVLNTEWAHGPGAEPAPGREMT
jgi:[ribosomal protein S5]-alanine N-acetyltransferase